MMQGSNYSVFIRHYIYDATLAQNLDFYVMHKAAQHRNTHSAHLGTPTPLQCGPSARPPPFGFAPLRAPDRVLA